MAVAKPTLQKRAAESRAFTIDLTPAMRKGDEVESMTSIAPTESGTTLSVDAISNDAGSCEFRVSGGASGTRAVLRIRWSTAGYPVQDLESLVTLTIR